MAPEQAVDSRQVDIRADIYSLGCTLYRLLAGRPPFAAPEYPGVVERILAHVNQPIPPLRSFRPGLPAELEAVLDRMLAKKPAGRYAIPREVALSLEPLAAGSDLPGLARQVVAPAGVTDRKRLASTPDFVSLPQTETRSGRSTGVRRSEGEATGRWKRRAIAAAGAGVILAIAVSFAVYQVVIRIRTDRPVTITNSPLGTRIDIQGSAAKSGAPDQGKPPSRSTAPAGHPPSKEAVGDASTVEFAPPLTHLPVQDWARDIDRVTVCSGLYRSASSQLPVRWPWRCHLRGRPRSHIFKDTPAQFNVWHSPTTGRCWPRGATTRRCGSGMWDDGSCVRPCVATPTQ